MPASALHIWLTFHLTGLAQPWTPSREFHAYIRFDWALTGMIQRQQGAAAMLCEERTT